MVLKIECTTQCELYGFAKNHMHYNMYDSHTGRPVLFYRLTGGGSTLVRNKLVNTDVNSAGFKVKEMQKFDIKNPLLFVDK